MAERPGDKALQEFLSEAQEIVENFNRCLLRLDEERSAGRTTPEVVNDAFRAVHSLKGLSGLFGVTQMTSLAHSLENLLDGLRLGKVELTPELLDLLFEGVELFNRIVADAGLQGTGATATARSEAVSVEDLVERIERTAFRPEARVAPLPGRYDFDPAMLAGLTEYEEHRLRENIKANNRVFRVRAVFPLLTIDQGLDELKGRLKPLGEIITLLPLPSTDDQTIALDLVLGSQLGEEPIAVALDGLDVELREMPRIGLAATATPTAPEPPQSAGPTTTAKTSPPPVEPPPPSRHADRSDAADDLEERPASLKSVSQTVRVDIRKLDHLMNVIGELVLARSGIQAILDEIKQDRSRSEQARALHREVRNLGRKLDELQAGILEVRMVPLGQVFDKLSRVVRKISREAGKEIQFTISGAETELDKLIVEELSDPLMHVIRNAIDHGIEEPQVRRDSGKPDTGTIIIGAEQRGNHVVIQVEDDGAGVDQTKLVRRAVERGFLEEAVASELSRREIFNLMFLPGVSTKDTANELSGRGVGMDVVKTNISRLSGIIDVESEIGIGTRLTITLPITLAIIQALIIRVAGRTYAVPLNSVLEALMVTAKDLRTIERREIVTLRGQTLPLLRLERLFKLERREAESERHFIVVVGMAQHRLGIMVDDLLGQQDIVIKSLGRSLEGVVGVSGATELGGQQTVLVLDVAGLVEEALSDKEVAA